MLAAAASRIYLVGGSAVAIGIDSIVHWISGTKLRRSLQEKQGLVPNSLATFDLAEGISKTWDLKKSSVSKGSLFKGARKERP